MPVTPTYPGVYIQEIPSGVRTITGVATSITAFVGYSRRGPTGRAVQVFNVGDYERTFGPLHRQSALAYAVHHFFQNGGSNAWIVRVAKGARRASVGLKSGVAATDPVVLTVEAISEGAWGNLLRVEIDDATANPASLFNLSVAELGDADGALRVARTETHRNLSMSSASSTYAVSVVNAASDLVRLRRPPGVEAAITNNGTSRSGRLTDADLGRLGNDARRLAVTVDGDGPREFDVFPAGGGLAGANFAERLADLAGTIQQAVRGLDAAFAQFACVVADGDTLLATSGTPAANRERSVVRFGNAAIRNAAAVLKLGVTNGGREVDAAAAIRPQPSGTVGGALPASLTGLAEPAKIAVIVEQPGVPSPAPVELTAWNQRPSTTEALRTALAAALRTSTNIALAQARVSIEGDRLRVVAGGLDPGLRLRFQDVGADTTATTLGLAGGVANVGQYAVGVGASTQAQTDAAQGDDGEPPDASDLRGQRGLKTGLYRLADVDLFNLLCLPGVSDVAVLGDAIAYAAERRAFVVLDYPDTVKTPEQARQWLAENGTLRHRNAAIYFPRIHAADPTDGNRLRPFPACGAVAGLYARIDGERGVWKAPAGTEAVLRGVRALDYALTDPEHGTLNPLAINGLRSFPVYGPVAWGARTLEGADALASEWKYVPVRRLALFLEESLFRGTQWVVFEPNDEPLWAQIRLNVGAFLHNLFRQGAFQGTTPREAYFVKCDAETTTQNDRDLGIVNIVVGFAPLKPAEFVIVSIQQIAGQVAA